MVAKIATGGEVEDSATPGGGRHAQDRSLRRLRMPPFHPERTCLEGEYRVLS